MQSDNTSQLMSLSIYIVDSMSSMINNLMNNLHQCLFAVKVNWLIARKHTILLRVMMGLTDILQNRFVQ